jgi:hypothetical protein
LKYIKEIWEFQLNFFWLPLQLHKSLYSRTVRGFRHNYNSFYLISLNLFNFDIFEIEM